MKLKGLLVGLLAVAALIGAFAVPTVNAAPAQKAEWRYLLYLVADNSLDVNVGNVPVVEDDFDELMSVGSTDEVVCYVFVDRLHGPANLFKVHKGYMEEMTDFSLDGVEANMGDPATLRSFVQYTYKATPAEHTVLMFWDHGSPNYIAWDDNGPEEGVGDAMTHLEVIEALDRYRVDIIGADECNVGQIEVAYEYSVRGPECSYLLASETYTGWRGYPYDQTLGRLVADPQVSPRECAVMFIEEVNILLSQPPYMGESVNVHAAIDLMKVRELAASLKDLTELLMKDMKAYNGAISKARGAAAYVYGATAVDLMDLRNFVLSVSESLGSKEIRSACSAVLEDFDDTVIALQVPKNLEGSVNGLGIRFAMHEWDIPAYYYGFSMPNEFWLAFLGAYWAAVGN